MALTWQIIAPGFNQPIAFEIYNGAPVFGDLTVAATTHTSNNPNGYH
jgi:hypothetical protein